MKTLLPRFAALMFTTALVLAATGATARAQARFVPVAEGIQDIQTGLVWGYTYDEMQLIYDASLGITDWPVPTASTWNGGSADVAGYESISNEYFNRNDTWRLPTLEEVQAAEKAGIGAYLNYYLGTSLYGYYWSATPAKNKHSQQAYAYDLLGQAGLQPVGQYFTFIPVHAGN